MPKNSFGALTAARLLAASFLVSCSSHPLNPAITPSSSAAAPSALLPAGQYQIDPARTEIRLLVYRAGPLAYLGHNHVIVNRGVSGTALVAPAGSTEGGAAASFSLTIPAAGFVVDDAGARSEEGADFAAEVSDDARSGTLHNLLSAQVLDAARFATITLDSVSVSVSVAADAHVATSTVMLDVAGHRSTLVVPFTIVKAGGRVDATGQVTLRQSAIGLTPFRALLGALAVQDEFEVKFHVVALRP